jgi:hypothetical protein
MEEIENIPFIVSGHSRSHNFFVMARFYDAILKLIGRLKNTFTGLPFCLPTFHLG